MRVSCLSALPLQVSAGATSDSEVEEHCPGRRIASFRKKKSRWVSQERLLTARNLPFFLDVALGNYCVHNKYFLNAVTSVCKMSYCQQMQICSLEKSGICMTHYGEIPGGLRTFPCIAPSVGQGRRKSGVVGEYSCSFFWN